MARHCSTILCAAVAALVALGLIMLTSTGTWVRGMDDPYHFLTRQALFVGIGLAAAFGASLLPVEQYRKYAPWLFVAACVLLVCCFVPGVNV